MPRFYFDIGQGHWHNHDSDGLELADLDAARGEAIAVLRELALDVSTERNQWEFVTSV